MKGETMADQNFIGGIHYEMMRRCYNPNSVTYSSFGAIGIKVCDEWHDREVFRKWAKENGFKKGLRLCRKDSSKDYSPENCYFGEGNKAKHGKNEAIKKSIKENKIKKARIGLKRYTDSPLYKTYYSMHTRCEKPNHKHFKHYGGRGITVCDEWSGENGFYNFHKWAQSSGWRPGLTLDRIDNEKGYNPDNCRWATATEQTRNRRTTLFFEYRGMKLTIKEISELEKISDSLLRYRLIDKKMSLQDAINECKQLKRR